MKHIYKFSLFIILFGLIFSSCNKTEQKSEEPLAQKEILYIRYDDANMKFVYLCAICDTVWNTHSK